MTPVPRSRYSVANSPMQGLILEWKIAVTKDGHCQHAFDL